MTEPVPQTPENTKALWNHLSDKLHSVVSQKADKAIMRIAARIVARRTNTSEEAFLQDFVTTLGRRIYVPFKVGEEVDGWSCRSQMLLAVHEHQHVAQWRRQPIRFLVRYARDPRQRALYEAEAFLAEVEAAAAFGWDPIDINQRLGTLRGYGVRDADIVDARVWLGRRLDSDFRMWPKGDPMTHLGRLAKAWAQKLWVPS